LGGVEMSANIGSVWGLKHNRVISEYGFLIQLSKHVYNLKLGAVKFANDGILPSNEGYCWGIKLVSWRSHCVVWSCNQNKIDYEVSACHTCLEKVSAGISWYQLELDGNMTRWRKQLELKMTMDDEFVEKIPLRQDTQRPQTCHRTKLPASSSWVGEQ
jgi:hypothetical protein